MMMTLVLLLFQLVSLVFHSVLPGSTLDILLLHFGSTVLYSIPLMFHLCYRFHSCSLGFRQFHSISNGSTLVSLLFSFCSTRLNYLCSTQFHSYSIEFLRVLHLFYSHSCPLVFKSCSNPVRHGFHSELLFLSVPIVLHHHHNHESGKSELLLTQNRVNSCSLGSRQFHSVSKGSTLVSLLFRFCSTRLNNLCSTKFHPYSIEFLRVLHLFYSHSCPLVFKSCSNPVRHGFHSELLFLSVLIVFHHHHNCESGKRRCAD